MEKLFGPFYVIIQPVSFLFGAFILGLIVYFILITIIKPLIRQSKTSLDDHIVYYCRKPVLALILIITIHLVIPLTHLPSALVVFMNQLLSILMILTIAFLVIRLTKALETFFLEKYDVQIQDNLKARAVHTQIRILKQIIYAVVTVLALGMILMTFPKVRQLGTSILASAGIMGIIVGFAAQRSIATLLAGIQVAITQPIRLDDVVVVENEWGRIEEITLTYVVVRIWDQRRLMLPITYFLEKPFQNWTRVSAEILGTVFLYVDYSVPVFIVRKELEHILSQSDLWDRRTCVLQVTNTTDHSVELRALMSASDSSKAWELRCLVRERLVDFLQKKYPGCLPRVRAQMENVQEPIY
ncbi:MAG: mechanosensitive ion channel [Deltaproteobacteria bacterium]|nr:mechanosensitive ion channel [Deltaproteobacteria bacterium]